MEKQINGIPSIAYIKKRPCVKNGSVKELAELFDVSEWTAERMFKTNTYEKGRPGVNAKTIMKIRKIARDIPYFYDYDNDDDV